MHHYFVYTLYKVKWLEKIVMKNGALRKYKAAVTVYSRQCSDILLHRRKKMNLIQCMSSNLPQLERMDTPNIQMYSVATTLTLFITVDTQHVRCSLFMYNAFHFGVHLV